ncbi:hypothetical protein GCM10027565_32950 [Bordetella tumulicola]
MASKARFFAAPVARIMARDARLAFSPKASMAESRSEKDMNVSSKIL